MRALFLLANQFEDIQFFCPYFRLLEEGVEVTVTGTDRPHAPRHFTNNDAPIFVVGQHGYTQELDMRLSDINPADYDILIIPGGRSPEKLRLQEEAVNIARTFTQEGSLVAAIGHGPQLLVSAGSLANRAATSALEIRDDVRCADSYFRDEPIVVDGPLITARGNEEIHLFCQQIVTALTSKTR